MIGVALKVTLVTDQWKPRGGGRERYLAELAAWVTARRDHVEVLCLRDRSGSASDPRVETTAVGGPRVFAERRLDHAVKQLRRSDPKRPVLAARPQIGATHYQLHSGLYAEAFAAERESLESALRRLLFWPTLRLNPHRIARLTAERRVLRPGSEMRLMTFTHRLAGVLGSQFLVDPERVCVSRPGVNVELFAPTVPAGQRPPAPADDGLRLLFVGHDFVLKGLGTAITALARCRSFGLEATLTVAGDGPAKRFQGFATRQGVAPNVRFLGAVPQKAVAELYRSSHVLIHPSYFDPFSRVVLEALASGCPVIATRRCGATELMEDGAHGHIIERPEDAHAFAAACESLADRKVWRKMSEAAVELARSQPFSGHASRVREWLLCR